MTLESLYDEAGVSERVARRARRGECTLPRHQVTKVAELLGCTLAELVDARDLHSSPGAYAERCRAELASWPVPLNSVPSWVKFVDVIGDTQRLDQGYGDEVVDYSTAAQIQVFMDVLASTKGRAVTGKAMAVAALKDAADDLRAGGLHVLVGRYVERTHPVPGDARGHTGVRLVTVVRIRRETGDAGHIVDRSSEPLSVSDEEDFRCEDWEWTSRCLEWEGKDRLALWPEPDRA